MAIVALRFVVGAHFFHEGYTKWRDPKPFSAPVFSAAKGPAADFYHGLVWDRDGLFRLDKETTFRIWGISYPNGEKKDPEFSGGYLTEAIHHFGFDQDQTNEAAALVVARANQYRTVLDLHEADVEEYRSGLKRRAANDSDPARKLASFGKHDSRINTELNSKRMPWQTEIDKIWQGLEKDMNALADRHHVDGDPSKPRLSSRGYLPLDDRPGQSLMGTRTMDKYVPYFDMTIGVLLIVGLFTRVVGALGAAFLATIIVSQWPFASDAISTGYQQVEMCALLVLSTIGAGRYAGLDALLGDCCSWCCRRNGTPTQETKVG